MLHTRPGRGKDDLLPSLRSQRRVEDTSKHTVNHHTVPCALFPSPALRMTFQKEKEAKPVGIRLSEAVSLVVGLKVSYLTVVEHPHRCLLLAV